ncbi:MAG: TetR/AcrR family transcriptional regulator, regulator of mycofactocin system [Actinomycetota bacterium]|nr:TetR/AcrR family transcriptional regulator, regulator of mycofactocin system [Actinomycetota bacterium]
MKGMSQDPGVMTGPGTVERAGRPPVTTAAELERVALTLFTARGFAATTVDDIAAAAGISRRTFFRYYASKKDVVWGDFDQGLRHMTDVLREVGDDVPLREAVRTAVIRFNALPAVAVPAHRQRMQLILHVPELQAHGTLRYAAWRAVIAEFAAGRLRRQVDDLMPQLVGHLALGAALAAYTEWLRDEEADLERLLHTAFSAVNVTATPA